MLNIKGMAKQIKELLRKGNKYEHNLSKPRGYKTFLMLNSAEHELYSANKSKIINKCNVSFSC